MRNSCGDEEKGLYIFISDDGSGFDYDAELYEGFSGIKRLGGQKHFGLIGMKKRCQLIGAEFSVSSAPNEGTQVSIFKRMRKL
ncbi:MAG: ATP-binding protein [Treponema sp.]